MPNARRSSNPEPTRTARRRTVIKFVCDPPQDVYIDRKKLRETPAEKALEASVYKIKFVDGDGKSSRTIDLKVEDGKPQTIECPR